MRLVALSPAIAVMLGDLGLQSRIVARHDYDLVLPDDLPSAGHQQRIDYETLIAVRPTHVVLEWGARPLPQRLTRLAERRGWTVMNYSMTSLDEIAAAWDDLALDLLGDRPRPPISREGLLPDVDPDRLDVDLPSAALARALRPLDANPDNVGRVLLLAGLEPPGVLGPGSAHHDVLGRLGVRPAVDEGSPWMTLDLEDILTLSPDAIVIVKPRAPGTPDADPTPDELRERLGRLAELGIPAVRRDRIALIDHPLALLGGSAIIDYADELRDILRRWGGPPSEPANLDP